MLNQTGVETNVYGAPAKTILVDEFNSTAFSVVVNATGVTADSDGKKIIKAGTPLYGSLEARNTAFTVTGGEGATPVGIALHDVDVTGLTGTATRNSQILVFGFVDLNKLDASVVTALTASVRASLNMIKFVK